MPRDRHQNGWVEEIGKRIKKWRGHYFVYETNPDGTEQRKHKAPILGLKAEMKKGEAQKKLQALILDSTVGKAPIKPSEDVTLSWFWEHRFLALKKRRWKPSSLPKTERFVRNYLLARFADTRLGDLNRFELQDHVNQLAERGFSKSVVAKAIVYLRSILEEALEQEFIGKNPARKLEMPNTKKSSERVLAQDEIAELLASLAGRDRLIVRMLIVLGLRPGELFALRRNDRIAPGQLRIDETVSEELRGENKIVEPKTAASVSYVWLPESIQRELDFWMESLKDLRSEAFVFPSAKGTVMSFSNFLARNVKPAAERARARLMRGGHQVPAGFLEGVNHQVLRRTCATHMQKLGSIKDIQSHLRHANSATTMAHYIKEVPESVRVAVESLDQKLMSRAAIDKSALN